MVNGNPVTTKRHSSMATAVSRPGRAACYEYRGSARCAQGGMAQVHQSGSCRYTSPAHAGTPVRAHLSGLTCPGHLSGLSLTCPAQPHLSGLSLIFPGLIYPSRPHLSVQASPIRPGLIYPSWPHYTRPGLITPVQTSFLTHY